MSLAIVIAMVAGCDMPVAPEPGAPPAAGPQQPAEVTTCNGTPARTRTDWQYPASVDAVFTGSERRALSRLHAEGWNGEGVAIVVRDEFNADGSPSHGEAVLDVARHYAPNALFIRSSKTTEGARQPPDEYFQRHNPVQVSNNSFGGSPGPGIVDALPVEQSGTTSEGVLEVWAAGNVQRPMGRSPADAVPAIEHNVFVHVLAQAFDFTELMHTETPCTGSGCRNGLLHAKSGVLVVGAVDYRSDLDDWTLSHSHAHGGRHSARAGNARNAFLVAPDDNREETFAGTSFAAPRVSAALAILKQKCPDLSSRHLSFILLKSARDLGEQGVDKVYGFGLLDLERAFEQAESLAAMFESYDSKCGPGRIRRRRLIRPSIQVGITSSMRLPFGMRRNESRQSLCQDRRVVRRRSRTHLRPGLRQQDAADRLSCYVLDELLLSPPLHGDCHANHG